MTKILTISAFILLSILPKTLLAQNETCSKLGVWLWYIEITGFTTHQELSSEINGLGAKRVYVKVADGRVNTDVWPELIDKNLVDAYKKKNLEVWAWSYNYPNNDSLQAEALYMAASTGYQGFVVDVEMEFDNKTTELSNLFKAFDKAKKKAKANGIINDDFKLYVTTWGNPKDHKFSIKSMDPYVDGYVPQTYVENWGQTYINNLTFWINKGNNEYKELGATKPIHHLLATEKNIITSAQIDEFIEASGSETALWRVPGGGVPQSVWNTWKKVNWDKNFCTNTSVKDAPFEKIIIYPNPTYDLIYLTNLPQPTHIYLRNQLGVNVVSTFTDKFISLKNYPSGIYYLGIDKKSNIEWTKIVKL
ncbi:MAG: hypothetical protein RLZZ546_519 [Bacteroidota bacterium]|jgi:hypothetical protein